MYFDKEIFHGIQNIIIFRKDYVYKLLIVQKKSTNYIATPPLFKTEQHHYLIFFYIELILNKYE